MFRDYSPICILETFMKCDFSYKAGLWRFMYTSICSQTYPLDGHTSTGYSDVLNTTQAYSLRMFIMNILKAMHGFLSVKY